MLKKAGILMAATTAGLLAVSPLAFAGAGHDDDDDDARLSSAAADPEIEQRGLVNLGDVDILNDVNVCPAIPIAVGNVLGILGTGEASATSDLTCTTNGQAGSGG